MTEPQEKLYKTMKKASKAAIAEDIKLLKKLAKH